MSRPRSPPASPRTVAGATAGAASRLAATATRLTCPESAATTGVQATCAASGTDTASATQRGVHRISASRQTGASSRMPAVARTDRAKPAVTASRGQTSSSPSTATPSPRVPRERPLLPIPTSATVPIAAARTTLGSARAVITNPTIPSPASTWSQRPRTPHQRARMSRKPTTSVRLVPLTASRWVRPVVRKSSARSGSRPPSSPTTRAGTRSRASASRPATAARTDRRTAAAASHHRSGAATTVGSPVGPDQGGHVVVAGHEARRGLDRGAERRGAASRRVPSARPGRRAATPDPAPRPAGPCACATWRSPYCPATTRTSEVSSSRTVTTAPSSASPVRGEVATNVCWSAATPATATRAASGPSQAAAQRRRSTPVATSATRRHVDPSAAGPGSSRTSSAPAHAPAPRASARRSGTVRGSREARGPRAWPHRCRRPPAARPPR